MENLYCLPSNGKKAMEEELIRGRGMANQLLEVLTFDYKSNIEVKGSNSKSSKVLPLIAGDLVREVLKSLTNTLLLLNNGKDSSEVAVPRDFSFSTNCHKVEEDSDGSCKKLKTINNKSLKGSNKRKSISPTWEKTTSILIDDGHTWRKYGQKKIANSTKYFRSYYRCTHMNEQHCEAIKHVQRTQENPPLYRTTYYGHHTCKNSFHSDIDFDTILSSNDSSMLLSFDNNFQVKEEYSFPPSPSPLLTSTKEHPMEETHDNYFSQNQFFSSENLLSCNLEVYFDYLRHATMLSSIESFEFENVYDQLGF